MSNSNWNYPTTVWFGQGRVKDLHIACKNLSITKPLFVTDQDLAKTDLVKKIINDSSLKSFSINIFSELSSEASFTNINCTRYTEYNIMFLLDVFK